MYLIFPLFKLTNIKKNKNIYYWKVFEEKKHYC